MTSCAWRTPRWASSPCSASLAAAIFSPITAAPLTALIVTGQLVCSVVFDYFGWVGFTEHPAGVERVFGCLLMAAGFFLIALLTSGLYSAWRTKRRTISVTAKRAADKARNHATPEAHVTGRVVGPSISLTPLRFRSR